MRYFVLIFLVMLSSFFLIAEKNAGLRIKKIFFSARRMKPSEENHEIIFLIKERSKKLFKKALSKAVHRPQAKISLLGLIDFERSDLDLFPLKAREGYIDFEEEELASLNRGKAIVHFETGNWNWQAFSPRATTFLSDFTYKAKGLAGHLQALIRKDKEGSIDSKAVSTERLNHIRAFTLNIFYDEALQAIHCEVDGKSLSVNFQSWFLSHYFPKPITNLSILKKEMHEKREMIKSLIDHPLMEDEHCLCEKSFFLPIVRALRSF